MTQVHILNLYQTDFESTIYWNPSNDNSQMVISTIFEDSMNDFVPGKSAQDDMFDLTYTFRSN